MRVLTPLIVLGGLLIVGGLGKFAAYPILDFVSHPKGALFAAATLALIGTHPEARRDCLDTAMRRTGWLLIVIGAASAFGGMISHFVPLDRILPTTTSAIGVLVTLFLMTMIIKLIYGSAMATFATAAALLAPVVVHATSVPPIAAVFAICLGSFAILPTEFLLLAGEERRPGGAEGGIRDHHAGGRCDFAGWDRLPGATADTHAGADVNAAPGSTASLRAGGGTQFLVSPPVNSLPDLISRAC